LSISPGVGGLAAADFVASGFSVTGGLMPARKVAVAGFVGAGAGRVGFCAASLAAAAARAARRAFLIARNFFIRSLRSRRLRSFSARIWRLLNGSPSVNSVPFPSFARWRFCAAARLCRPSHFSLAQAAYCTRATESVPQISRTRSTSSRSARTALPASSVAALPSSLISSNDTLQRPGRLENNAFS
jgi:hypothetical protein